MHRFSNIETAGRTIAHGGRLELLKGRTELYIGVDIGSISSDLAVLDANNRIISHDYKRTKGRPVETFKSQLETLFGKINPARIGLFASTGSAARQIAELINTPFVNEVLAQAAAVSFLYPDLEQTSVIEMGGQESKLIFMAKGNGRLNIRDFALNTACAAGTGAFLDQQAQRLGIDIENQFGQLAIKSKNIPRLAGRCSVFAKSDMIHLQQQATPTCDIIAGLCLALAAGLKTSLGCGKEFHGPIIFTGGVAANIGVVRAFENVFDLQKGELIVPTEHFYTGAIGAVLLAKKMSQTTAVQKIDFEKIDDFLAKRRLRLRKTPRHNRLNAPGFPPPKSLVYEHLLTDAHPVNAFLGLDVGSISTNLVVMDEQKHLLAKEYLMTAGNPLEAVKQGLKDITRKVKGKVNILAAATTGSGRYLTGDFIGADVVINEITAQAAGTAIVNPDVDTIFEIGGQDSKYISLQNGVVVDFEMNHACAAGTGSFLEEQAQRLGININHEFADMAFQSAAPIKLGQRCTVFIESDLISFQQQGAALEDLVAGLGFSIVSNYLNRVVGHRKIGNNICFQGGTAFNKAVWAAFEKITGKPILVPDHHEVTGALGAASIAQRHLNKLKARQTTAVKTKFKGFENLTQIDYTVESFSCPHCPNNCEIKKVNLPDSQPLFYGSRCDRYNLKKTDREIIYEDPFKYRYDKMLNLAGLSDKTQKPIPAKTSIGIPQALVYSHLLPLFAHFFKDLGFDVVLSGRTTKKTIRTGIESVAAQTCFPVKVAYGHVLELLNSGVDYIFLPSIVSMGNADKHAENNQLCPYVQSFPYQLRTALAATVERTKILTVPLQLTPDHGLMRQSFVELGAKLNISASKIRQALENAVTAQTTFERSLIEKGKEILENLGPDERMFILISRPYNGCDEGVNLQLPRKLANLGVKVMPMDMLDLSRVRISDSSLDRQLYWTYGRKILKAAEIIKQDPRLFAIYLSNFSCGPDSFLMTFFKETMHPKPSLLLELDEHSADAGLITRLEAFLESLKQYEPKPPSARPTLPLPLAGSAQTARTIYIPYMSDCSYGMAACFRAYGQPADVMDVADESTLAYARKFTSGKECLPCAITAGEMLNTLRKNHADPDSVAFFMPSTSGPCRFGMYNCMHKLILKYVGAENTPVIAPNQSDGFYSQLAKNFKRSAKLAFTRDIWTAAVGIDLLNKLILRLRPFTRQPQHAQQIYDRALKDWIKLVENRTGLGKMIHFMQSVAEKFDSLQYNSTNTKPGIGIVGEIYVRSHSFANTNIVRRLEQLGAACDLAAPSEWVYYTNFTRAQQFKNNRKIRDRLFNACRDFLQRSIERKLAKPLEKKFGALAEGPTQHLIHLAEPYVHRSFEGEAILTIGKMIEYYQKGFGGIVNVMPFTCMPSTFVTTQTARISRECGNMPILNIIFDGQEDPAFTTRLEAFVDQVRQRKSTTLTMSH
jgi:predicted CoA-substrate-specific enzyme activase